MELISIEMPGVVVHSVYKPPNEKFVLPALGNGNLPHIVIGDFNSHSTTWGYTNTDDNGEAVEQWADSCNLTLIHIRNRKMKVATRNNLLTKLATSKWGANPRTIRTTSLALSYYTAEYAAPVWARSAHAKNLDPELNQACRSVTGCLQPTNVEDLYLLSGISPPTTKRCLC